MKKLIGIKGKAYSGKTTAAKYLEGKGFVRLAFANEIKSLAMKHFGLSAEDVFEHKPPYVRAILQSVGMLIREVAPRYLLDRMSAHIEFYSAFPVVIDDVRMPDEAEYIRGKNGVIVKIVCPDSPHSLKGIQQAHATEVNMDNIIYDYLIEAEYGNLEHIRREIERIAG